MQPSDRRSRALILATACWGVILLGNYSLLAGEPPRRGGSQEDLILLEKSSRIRFRVGMRIEAKAGPIQQAVASVAIPMGWPEQEVQLLNTEVPDEVPLETRRLGGTAEQFLSRLPLVPRGSSVLCVGTWEITRWTQRLRPEVRDRLVAAPAAPNRAYLQPSDGIESSHPEIRRLANEVVADMRPPLTRAAALFNASREKIHYEPGPFVGALRGLRTGRGDCEELSCLFVALCRASGIPARLVRGPDHCWSEFALNDESGRLCWIPADPTKEQELGLVRHFIPILQKGDRFVLPELPQRTWRYLTPTCTGLGPVPKIESIEQLEPIADRKR